MPRASVIVPARDAGATLPRTLAALASQQLDGGFEVIVIDDGSRDGSAELARAADGPVTVLQQPPQGPAAARNLGAATARGAALAFCDADVFPTPSWLAAGVAALEEADLVQGRVVADPAAELGPFDRSLWISSQVGLWETANLFVTRAMFDAAGGFEDWLAPRWGKTLAEDVWFGHRALRAGARPAFCAAALAYHAVIRRSWAAYVGERLRLRFFPPMVRRMPELRDSLLTHRLFLTDRSASFDLALIAGLVAWRRRSPLPLAAAGPYAAALVANAQRGGGPVGAVGVAAADAVADALGCAALAGASVRHRSLVL
jgi:glycosyltransferase involved in cell wall biosynthesis